MAEDAGELRRQVDRLEAENQSLREDATRAALHGQELLERCARLEEERSPAGRWGLQLQLEGRASGSDSSEGSGSAPSRPRTPSGGGRATAPSRQSVLRPSVCSPGWRTNVLGEVVQLREQDYTHLQQTMQLERDLGKREELVRALEEERQGLAGQLEEQRRREQKLEKERGGLEERLGELSAQVGIQQKLITSLVQQLEAAKEELETPKSYKPTFAHAASAVIANQQYRRQWSDNALTSPLGDSSCDDDNRELLEACAAELQAISGSQKSLAGNIDAKLSDVRDRLDSLTVTLHRHSLDTQAPAGVFQMGDAGEILNRLKGLKEQLDTVHVSVRSMAARPDSGAALGRVEGAILGELHSFWGQILSTLEVLREQQDASSRQLRAALEALQQQHRPLGGLGAPAALGGQSAAEGAGAERLQQEVARLHGQLAARLEGAWAGCERGLRQAAAALRREGEALGDLAARRALEGLRAEGPGLGRGEAEGLRQEVLRLQGQLAGRPQEHVPAAAVVESCTRPQRGAAEPKASDGHEREARRLRAELASAEHRARDRLQDRAGLTRHCWC